MKAQLLKTAILILLAANVAVAQTKLNNYRPIGQDGNGIFEAPKDAETEFDGIKVKVGGAFAQQYQMLKHTNAFDPNDVNSVVPELGGIRYGFNNATANLNVDVQLHLRAVHLHSGLQLRC